MIPGVFEVGVIFGFVYGLLGVWLYIRRAGDTEAMELEDFEDENEW